MYNVQNLKIFVSEKCEKYPNLKNQILDLYWLCMTEISEGGDDQTEVGRCFKDIEEIIEELKN
jgi:hypothetical protein